MNIELVYHTPRMLQLVEVAGRTCYRSEAKISADSAAGFVARIVGRGHESVIEHSNAVFSVKNVDADIIFHVLRLNRFLTCVPVGGTYYLAGNIRMYKDLVRAIYSAADIADTRMQVFLSQLIEEFYKLPQAFFVDFIEAGWMNGDSFLPEKQTEPIVPEVIYEENGQVVELLHLDSSTAFGEEFTDAQRELLAACTMRLKTSRDSSHQEVRHRPAAYSQESQRYVDLQQRLEYIHPTEIPVDAVFAVDVSEIPSLRNLLGTESEEEGKTVLLSFADMIHFTKACYTAMRQAGYKPEVARGILPNATATTLVVTRTLAQWRHYLTLRGEAAAQRPIRERAHAILAYLQECGWLQDLIL